MKYCGMLGNNHLLGAGSLIGLYPNWFYDQCVLDPSSNAFEFVVDRFSVWIGMTGLDSFFKTLCVAFACLHGVTSPQSVENVCCKVFKVFGALKESRTTYHNVVIMGQQLFLRSEGDTTTILHWREKVQSVRGSLI